jgi:hypothetical protein
MEQNDKKETEKQQQKFVPLTHMILLALMAAWTLASWKEAKGALRSKLKKIS